MKLQLFITSLGLSLLLGCAETPFRGNQGFPAELNPKISPVRDGGRFSGAAKSFSAPHVPQVTTDTVNRPSFPKVTQTLSDPSTNRHSPFQVVQTAVSTTTTLLTSLNGQMEQSNVTTSQKGP